MRKLLRFIAVSAGAAAIIGLALAMLVPRLLDQDVYKQQLSALVKQQTGHTLVIDGDITLALLPWLALELGPVQLGNATGFGATPLATAQHASIRVGLLPLLRKQIKVGRVSLDGLRVHLARDVQGRVNWHGLVAPFSAEASSGPDAAGQAMRLREVGAIELRDAYLEWDDRTAGKTYTVSDLNLQTGRFTPGTDFSVSIGGTLAGGPDTVARRIQWDSRVNADPATQRYQLHHSRLSMELPDGTVTLSGDVELDLRQQRLSMPAMELVSHAFKLSGRLHGARLLDHPELGGELQIAPFNPREALQALGLPVPASADPVALSRASAVVSLRGGREHLTLQVSPLRLDDSDINGEISLRDFADPRFGFKLAVDDIDLDRYLAPADAPPGPGELWPVEFLRSLNLDGSLHIGRLRAFGLLSTDVQFLVTTPDGVPRVQPAIDNLARAGAAP